MQRSGPQGTGMLKTSAGESAFTPLCGGEREGPQAAEGIYRLCNASPSTQTIENNFAEPAMAAAAAPANGITAN